MKILLSVFFCVLCFHPNYLCAQNSVTIYEYGNTIRNYEDNFKNLINNWNKRNVTNADEYEILECSFVETISTGERYNYYRNYFSSDQPISCSTSSSSSLQNGKEKYEFFIRPGYPHPEYYDARNLPENMKAIFSDEFGNKAKDILSKEFNIDTMNLQNHTYSQVREESTQNSWNRSSISDNILSPDSLSKNYTDVFLKGEKSILELSVQEAQDVFLEELLIKRMNQQAAFNNWVKMGDTVFVIKFKYNHQLYSNYIICSAETKKVIWDNFFSRIQIKSPTS